MKGFAKYLKKSIDLMTKEEIGFIRENWEDTRYGMYVFYLHATFGAFSSYPVPTNKKALGGYELLKKIHKEVSRRSCEKKFGVIPKRGLVR